MNELVKSPTAITVTPSNEIAVANTGRLTYGERKVIEEYRTQMAVVTAQTAKTIYAEQMYGKLARTTHDVAVQTIGHIEQTQQATKSTAIRTFCEREKQIYMYQTLEMLTTGGEMLHREVGRSLYPPPRRRLFGG